MATILGISAFYHDSAAALVRDNDILAACQQERFSRVKHDARFPSQAIAACLSTAGVSVDAIDAVVFFEKPFVKFERWLETYAAFAPRGVRSFAKAMPLWVREKLFQKATIRSELDALGFNDKAPLLFSEHHLSHAASAFYPSPFECAVCLTMDGVGEWATTTAALGDGERLQIDREIRFPHSLGLLYSAFTYFCGFHVNSGEYKLMGLAPYGKPIYRDRIEEQLIDIKADGSFRLNLDYFDYATGLQMTNSRFAALFDGPRRDFEAALTQREMDLAASVQILVEDIVLRLAHDLADRYDCRNLVMAGGVALNCVANGKLRRSRAFDHIWVQPAAGDAGGALGAALYAAYNRFGAKRRVQQPDAMGGAYLGNRYAQSDIETTLQDIGAKFDTLSDQELIEQTATLLAQGAAIGWFQGAMEYGPRALGNRSIIADPRSPKMQRTLNLKVKYRESFRPFAPAVLADKADQWFDMAGDSPYMLMVEQVAADQQLEVDPSATGLEQLHLPRSTIPAVTHVDGSARVQTVHAQTNPRFYALLSAFDAKTNCPVLVNTSFNVRGEPIVESPEQAWNCFASTHLDALVIGNCLLRKSGQPLELLHAEPLALGDD